MSNGSMKIVLYGDGNRITEEHVIHVINSHRMHMRDILNSTVLWEIVYKSDAGKYSKIY